MIGFTFTLLFTDPLYRNSHLPFFVPLHHLSGLQHHVFVTVSKCLFWDSNLQSQPSSQIRLWIQRATNCATAACEAEREFCLMKQASAPQRTWVFPRFSQNTHPRASHSIPRHRKEIVKCNEKILFHNIFHRSFLLSVSDFKNTTCRKCMQVLYSNEMGII